MEIASVASGDGRQPSGASQAPQRRLATALTFWYLR
jgi:hypothetical protein